MSRHWWRNFKNDCLQYPSFTSSLAGSSFSEEQMVKHTLEMRNIVKRFPGVLANNNANLTIHAEKFTHY